MSGWHADMVSFGYQSLTAVTSRLSLLNTTFQISVFFSISTWRKRMISKAWRYGCERLVYSQTRPHQHGNHSCLSKNPIFRREQGMCQICYSADAVIDVSYGSIKSPAASYDGKVKVTFLNAEAQFLEVTSAQLALQGFGNERFPETSPPHIFLLMTSSPYNFTLLCIAGGTSTRRRCSGGELVGGEVVRVKLIRWWIVI